MAGHGRHWKDSAFSDLKLQVTGLVWTGVCQPAAKQRYPVSASRVCGPAHQDVLRGCWVPPQPGQLRMIETGHMPNLLETGCSEASCPGTGLHLLDGDGLGKQPLQVVHV